MGGLVAMAREGSQQGCAPGRVGTRGAAGAWPVLAPPPPPHQLASPTHHCALSSNHPTNHPTQEPNFHATYVLLVDKWGERRMRDTLVETTVHYIKVSCSVGCAALRGGD